MRSNFTKFGLTLFAVFSIIIVNITSAQTLVDVATVGSSFSPSTVTINPGDTVRWTNGSSSHNVNGTTGTFPSNPESFGNAVTANWVFTYVFNTVGTYDYQCDLHAGMGMTGIVTVQTPTGDINNNVTTSDKAILKTYPVPASDYVVFELSQKILSDNAKLIAVVYDLTGKEIVRRGNINSSTIRFKTEAWAGSIYTMKLLNGRQIIETEKFMVE